MGEGGGGARGRGGSRGAAASGPGLTPGWDRLAGGAGPLAPLHVGARLEQAGEAAPRHPEPGRADGCRIGAAVARPVPAKVGGACGGERGARLLRCGVPVQLRHISLSLLLGRVPWRPFPAAVFPARPEGFGAVGEVLFPNRAADVSRWGNFRHIVVCLSRKRHKVPANWHLLGGQLCFLKEPQRPPIQASPTAQEAKSARRSPAASRD